MDTPAKPTDEASRIDALRALGILDTPPEGVATLARRQARHLPISRCRPAQACEERDMNKILVIDDQQSVLTLYSKILHIAGFQVLTACGAKAGFDLAVSAQPNLILLDVMMPAVDGTEALACLSEDPGTKDIPVIFLTSLLSESEVQEAQGSIGGHEFISKSTPVAKMIARVRSALSGIRRGPYPGKT